MDNQSDFEYEDDLMEPEPPQKRTVPTVFQWENGGREVLLTGSFNDWKTRIPMSQRFLHMQLLLHVYIYVVIIKILCKNTLFSYFFSFTIFSGTRV